MPARRAIFNLGYLALLCLAGCATEHSRQNPPPLPEPGASGYDGPAVVYARAEPRVVEVDRAFNTPEPAEVLADIKDFTAKINDVKLRFTGIPLEVPMEFAGGTTWRATFTPRQLELLAVNGRTTRYEAHVVVLDEQGKLGATLSPVEIAIRAPEIPGSG